MKLRQVKKILKAEVRKEYHKRKPFNSKMVSESLRWVNFKLKKNFHKRFRKAGSCLVNVQSVHRPARQSVDRHRSQLSVMGLIK